MPLPIHSNFASEVFLANADVDWGSEALFYNLLESGGVMLDIGANIGYYTLYMQPKAGHIYAFEPNPKTRSNLTKHLSGFSNTTVFPFAVGRASGHTRFIMESADEISHLAANGEMSESSIDVEVVSVDDFASQRKLRVNAIKIDVEGFDYEVLLGARETIREYSPVVLTECEVTDDLLSFASSLACRIYAFQRHRHTRAVRFGEINAVLPGDTVTKMLFVVPRSQDLNIRRYGLISSRSP